MITKGTQRVWDYVGDGYVHRLICNKSDGKLVEFPSNNDQRENGNGGSSSVSKDKVEAVAMEYGMLLKTQLESQRERERERYQNPIQWHKGDVFAGNAGKHVPDYICHIQYDHR